MISVYSNGATETRKDRPKTALPVAIGSKRSRSHLAEALFI